MATTRNSLQYAKLYVNKYLAKSTDFGGLTLRLPFDHTHPSATVAGDIVNLCVIPANHVVVDMSLSREAMTSTAVIIGTPDLTNRFMQSQSWAARGQVTGVDLAGMLYRPTVDTIVLATFVTGNPTPASRFAGTLTVMYQG